MLVECGKEMEIILQGYPGKEIKACNLKGNYRGLFTWGVFFSSSSFCRGVYLQQNRHFDGL
jgi:hypothetical protein